LNFNPVATIERDGRVEGDWREQDGRRVGDQGKDRWELRERETISDVGASSFNSTVLMNALRSDQVESARFPPPM